MVPFAGSVAGSALAAASTFALGKAFCYYYRAVHKGHVPRVEDLRPLPPTVDNGRARLVQTSRKDEG